MRRKLFFIYLLAADWLLFCRPAKPSGGSYRDALLRHLNLYPLRTITRYWRLLKPPFRNRFWRLATRNLLGNFLLFLPMGYFLPLLFPGINRFWKLLLVGLGIITAVELCQLLLLVGTFDIDDILLNLAGMAVGYGCGKLHGVGRSGSNL